jgi:hypothetical protein
MGDIEGQGPKMHGDFIAELKGPIDPERPSFRTETSLARVKFTCVNAFEVVRSFLSMQCEEHGVSSVMNLLSHGLNMCLLLFSGAGLFESLVEDQSANVSPGMIPKPNSLAVDAWTFVQASTSSASTTRP